MGCVASPPMYRVTMDVSWQLKGQGTTTFKLLKSF